METRSEVRIVVVVLAWLLGTLGAVVAASALWSSDSSCPQWEDEGPMAAPHSPYSRVMCEPGDPPQTWAVIGPALLAAGATVLLLRRRRHGARPWQLPGAAVGLVLAPALTVGLLHLVLPQDCLSGRTETGDCRRDREG